jgi:hypothetical protein
MTVELMERCSDWFKYEEAFRVDESKRLEKGKNVHKVPENEDSLKTQDID